MTFLEQQIIKQHSREKKHYPKITSDIALKSMTGTILSLEQRCNNIIK